VIYRTADSSGGYLDDEAMKYMAAALRLPLSKVYGVWKVDEP